MTHTFRRKTYIAVPREVAFAWHEQPGAFECLAPPWEVLEVVKRSGGIQDGGELIFRVRLAPTVWQKWHARHYDFRAGEQFCDEQVSGPFSLWKHRHAFVDDGGGCRLLDEVEYQLPLAPLSAPAHALMVKEKIRAMFAYRTVMTRQAIEAHHNARLKPMKILMSGSTGLVGGILRPFLESGGHHVVPLRRGPEVKVGENSLSWNPSSGFSDKYLEHLEGFDAVIHLAGESILGPWTAAKKKAIRESRVVGTGNLAKALARLKNPPKVFVSASAIGYYGDVGPAKLDESARRGSGFLAETAEAWEEAAKPAADAGIRVVHPRIGIVLSARGGALATMKTPFSLGLGGRLGSGNQYMSWIAVDDLVGLIHHALATETLSGPFNAVAPGAVSNREFTRTLARVLRRPVGPPVPAFVLKMIPGGMGEEVFLASCRAFPTKAQENGYVFTHPSLEGALRHQLGRPGS
ncbi:MAG: TIGR01777 family oxidoreductase [Candidatus Sumerlaeia bacterium]|nr:TIGR01777 family oxidoreductase [Candidatus Sumerlaeia bacterium]